MTPALVAAYRKVLAAHASGDADRLAAALREVPGMLGTIALLLGLVGHLGRLTADAAAREALMRRQLDALRRAERERDALVDELRRIQQGEVP